MYGTGRLPEIAESNTMETLSVQNLQDGYDELLANIRRLTVMVLDNLEAGSRDRTLDHGQKRLLQYGGPVAEAVACCSARRRSPESG